MAGSLVQVATNTVSGTSTNSIDLVGTTTDDVYMVAITNASTTSDGQSRTRVLVSSSADTSSEYDQASKALIANASFSDDTQTNADHWRFMFTGNQTNETQSAILYLYNFNSSSEYSYGSFNNVSWVSTPQAFGGNGGFVHTVASASDGLSFFFTGGATFNNGAEIVLYRVV